MDNFNQDNFIEDSQGRLVPRDKVKAIDLLRDDLVNNQIEKVKAMSMEMKELKSNLAEEVKCFMSLSMAEYDVVYGGKKGNVTLRSYDGKRKIQIAISDQVVFDERLQAAKILIDEYLTDLTKDSDDDLKIIVNSAFQVNKEGKINVRKVLELRSYDITHEKWLRAMKAINDSLQVVGSTEYIRFYEKETSEEKDKQITLDFASL